MCFKVNAGQGKYSRVILAVQFQKIKENTSEIFNLDICLVYIAVCICTRIVDA